jgi:phenylalanyl-tRNA synthetase beta chain
MPVVSYSIKQLNKLLVEEFSMEVIVDSLKQLGCDVEDTAEITFYHCPACDALNDKLAREEPAKRCNFCGHEQEDNFKKFASDAVVRIDLLADRPDLFDVVGLSRALKGYLELDHGMPVFACDKGNIEVKVEPLVLEVRPYIVCAVAEVPPLDYTTLRELMKLQENLHWGVGRDRKLASIGIYNLDTLTPPIIYKSVEPTSFKFHPLTFPDVEMTPSQILMDHPKGTAYAHLLENFNRYPLLIDSKGLTLSMPPIINSDETKCRIGTSRLFIDVTGTAEQAPTDSLNILVCALNELGGKIQTVKIIYPDRSVTTPDLTPREIQVSFKDACRWLGVDFSREEFLQSIGKMRLNVRPKDKNKAKDTDKYIIEYGVYRSDIRHEVDIFEDVLVGYGVDRVDMKLVPSMTVGQERPEERTANTIRSIMTGLGFTEIMSLNLQSEESHFIKFGMEIDESYVRVENPKTINQRVLRSHLMTGLMETFEKNRKKSVPQHIFEIGPVSLLNPDAETGVNEYRHLVFGIIGPDAGYAEARAVLDSILRELGLKGRYRPVEHPTFIQGRCAQVDIDNDLWARLGELHPQVLNNFNLTYPLALCELCFAKVF